MPEANARLRPPSSPVTDERDLDRSLVQSLAWSGVGKWLPQLISWPATIIVARLLSPADYGFAALVGVYTRFVSLVTEGGLGPAVVVDRDVDPDRAAQLHTLALMVGLCAFTLSCVVAYPIQAVTNTPGLATVLVAASLIFVIDSLGVTPAALLRKQFRYKELAIADGARVLADVCVEIPMAFMGFGYWTLLAGYLAGAAAWLIIVLARTNPGFRRPNFTLLRSVIALGVQFSLRSITGFVTSSADVLIAGRLLDRAAVGTYSFAMQLATAPLVKVTSLVSGVAPALFASVSHDLPRLRRYALLLTEALAAVVVPALVGLALVAPDLISVLLGAKWQGSALPLQFLALYAAIYSVTIVFPNVLQTTGQANVAARNSAFSMCVLPPLFLLFGMRWGVAGIAAAWLVGFPVTFAPVVVRAMRTVEMTARQYLRSLWPAVSGSAAMSVAVLLLRRAGVEAGWSPLNRLALCALTGAVVYAAVTVIFYRQRLMAAVGTLRGARR